MGWVAEIGRLIPTPTKYSWFPGESPLCPPLSDNSICPAQGQNEGGAMSDNIRLATQVNDLSLGGGQFGVALAP